MNKQEKIKKVMREFKNGTLRSSDGKKVTSRKQAIAIAISESEDYAEKADLISAIYIGSVREAEEILKAAGTEGDLFEKAHKVGDVHPNGKWVWTEYKPGKFDWRGIKNGAKGGGGGASKPSPAPSVDLKGITAEDKAGLSSLASTLNNYYGYVDIHLSGKNKQRFSSTTITNFRNAVKEIYQGSKTSNTGVESESAKKLVKNIYDELKTVKSTDLQGAKDKIEKIAPMLKQALKQAKEPASTSKKASDQKSDVTIKKLDDASAAKRKTEESPTIVNVPAKTIAENLAKELGVVVGMPVKRKIKGLVVGLTINMYPIQLKEDTLYVHDGVFDNSYSQKRYNRSQGFTIETESGGIARYKLNGKKDGFTTAYSRDTKELAKYIKDNVMKKNK